MKFLIYLSALLTLWLCSSLAQEEKVKSYRLIPDDLSAKSHPVNQVGFKETEELKLNYFNGQTRTFDEDHPEFATVETFEEKGTFNSEAENLDNSIIRNLTHYQSLTTTITDGEVEKETYVDPLSNQELRIDMSKQIPKVTFADKNKTEANEDESWGIEDIQKNYQTRKQLNFWKPDILIYGKKERKVGDTWVLNEEELKQLSAWYKLLYYQNEGEYNIHSLQVKFKEVKLINQIPHAVFHINGRFSSSYGSPQGDDKTSYSGTSQEVIERNLMTYLDAKSVEEYKGTYSTFYDLGEGYIEESKSGYEAKAILTKYLPLANN